VFVRFSGCNLWSGIERTRAAGVGACAAWCDIDFRPRLKLTAIEVVLAIRESVDQWSAPDFVVFTGGEPLLQLDQALVDAVNKAFHMPTIAVETNGTVVPNFVHDAWFACAPKLDRAGMPLPLVLPAADEVKIILPGHSSAGWTPEKLAAIEARFPRATYWLHAVDPVSELATLDRRNDIARFVSRQRWRVRNLAARTAQVAPWSAGA
jgi:organic radical activating enzyme